MAIERVTVIGAGDMGHGIAELFAVNGFHVTLVDKFPQALEKAQGRISSSLDKLVEKGKVTKEQSEDAKSKLAYSGDLGGAVSAADLVVEAVPESVELKKGVLREASASAPPGAIFASNTSNIKISDLAEATDRPQRVVGMHFFNPPMLMKLVEVIPGTKTDPAVAQEVFDLCGKLGRTPVRVLKDSPGFIVNRINAADTLFFCLLLDREVASPSEVDTFARGQGLPMGPYELLDFVGVDVGADSLAYFASALSPEYGKGTTFVKMVKEGRLGKKTGRGFYDWSNGKAEIPKSDPTDKVSIMDIFALEINESVKLIEEGVATPDDIEKGVVLGMNRPFGPISVARDLSSAEVKAKLEELSTKYECGVFAPARSIAEGRLRDAIEGRVHSAPGREAPVVEANAAAPTGARGAIRLERLEGGVAKIVIDRPRLNLINGDVLDGLDGMLTDLWNDREIRAIVVTGEGTVFSAGFEMTKFVSSAAGMMEFARKGERTMRRLSEIPKLTIAVLKGYALGGGLELALSCDLRLATEDAELRFPELTRGLVPAWSGTQRLGRLVGLSRASAMILACESVTGSRAHEIGLVNRLLQGGDPDEQAVRYAKELASSEAPVAVMLAKKLLNKGGEVPMDVGLEMEEMAAGVLFGTEDLKEGISAFLGKRKPEFKGK
ncbi:MAG: enoyl-CoA hydratase/isomerase family protein [Nitrososphaerota archaeon]|nr:enoyl-CoA hydratase/isomerase family protein [Nitrososphaerota archaeon]MDG7013563.1 enoyl-CoA hydratase/isomerase family protein [Nitrososphaerota archaeon]MDG7025833.1 enoyl-CoA hydratase/isomerase family protein [Nitrososphaerota archaeon]